jgi:exopolysaccharide production protein ExoY
MQGRTIFSEQPPAVRFSPSLDVLDGAEPSENTGSLRTPGSRVKSGTEEWTESAAEIKKIMGTGSSTEDLLRMNAAVSGTGVSATLAPGTAKLCHIRVEGSRRLSFEVGKRVFDVFCAASALVVLFPVLLLCGAAILLESGGPVLFRQRRLGKAGREFHIVKFRTMVPNAEMMLRRVLASDPAANAEWQKDRKLRRDPRITTLGKFLRRTSLDELPQLWNVLIGDMSVVGPRPIVSAEIPRYAQAYRSYCSVRPGITGLWQVSGRNDSGYEQRIALDCEYVASWSTRLDMSIVCKTVRTVIAGRGAY